MYFNDDNPLGLIKSCHSVGKIKFPGFEEQQSSDGDVCVQFSDCIFPQLSVSLPRMCRINEKTVPVSVVTTDNTGSIFTILRHHLYGNTSHQLHLSYLYTQRYI